MFQSGPPRLSQLSSRGFEIGGLLFGLQEGGGGQTGRDSFLVCLCVR